MKTNRIIPCCVSALCALFLLLHPAVAGQDAREAVESPIAPAAPPPASAPGIGNVPLYFESNQGQFDKTILFVGRMPRKSFVFMRNGFDIHMGGGRDGDSKERVGIRFVGADPDVVVEGVGLLPGVANYFIGNDPDKWRPSIPTYSRLRYRGVFPGIDIEYNDENGMLRYTVTVHPGEDPARFLMAYESARACTVNDEGHLVVQVGDLQYMDMKPTAYQESDDGREEVAAQFMLIEQESTAEGGEAPHFGFEVGAYDPARPLFITPGF